MTIEDIDYLKENSINESVVLLIDSSKRDKDIYPDPSNFGIVLDEPICFVYGLQILDTTIPRTMFMMETHNNTLMFKFGFNISNKSGYQEIQFKSQDYASADSFVNNINEQMLFKFAEENITIDNKDNVYDGSYLRTNSDHPVLRFISPKPFYIDITESTCGTIFGFSKKCVTNENATNISSIINNQNCSVNRNIDYSSPFKIIDLVIHKRSILFQHNHLDTDASIMYINFSIRDGYTNISSISISIVNDGELIVRNLDIQTIGVENGKMTFRWDPLGVVSIKSNSNIYIYVDEQDDKEIEVNLECEMENTFVTYRLQESLQTYNCVYKHTKQYKMKTFLSQLLMKSANLLISNIYITIINKSSGDVIIIHELLDMVLNTTFEGILQETSSRIILDTYEYDMMITTEDQLETIKLGYSYFLDLNNIKINNNIYVSSPVLNITESTDTETIITKYNLSYSISSTYSTVNVDNNNVLEFNFGKAYSYNGTNFDVSDFPGCISEIRIPIANYENELNLLDIFVLSFSFNGEKVMDVLLEYIIIQHVEYLQYKLDSLQYSTLNLIDIDDGYVCKLYSKNKITLFCENVMGGEALPKNIAYDIVFTRIMEHGIKSSGMLNLASENYVVLRCEEIEDHIRGGFKMASVSPGLAVINMDVQGFAVGRMDFYSVIYKEFHPIGKLYKLEFRFERKSDGKLYDFKDIDLHFILSINFYRPKQKMQLQKSILNPSYNPNYLGYLHRSMEYIESDSESD